MNKKEKKIQKALGIMKTYEVEWKVQFEIPNPKVRVDALNCAEALKLSHIKMMKMFPKTPFSGHPVNMVPPYKEPK